MFNFTFTLAKYKNAIIAICMKYYFLAVVILFSGFVNAQSTKVMLKGTLLMATGEEFPYRLELTESNNVITGYSYTYDERDEAKTVIKGKVDKQAHKLTFKETEIVSSHSVFTKAFMCLLQASLEYRNGKLVGPATNKQLDNTSCTEGKLTFTNTSEIEQLFSSHDPYDVEIRMGEKKKEEPVTAAPKPASVAAEEPAGTDKITEGIEKSYDWLSDSVVVEVWDGGRFDGDIISILFDGKPVLAKYVIGKQKKRFAIKLPATGVHSVAILAEDEGSDPPNTASLALYDGHTKYSVLAYNNKGQQSFIKIRKAK